MSPNDEVLSKCLRQQKFSKEEQSWMKPMHSMYHKLKTKEVADIEKSQYQWLENSGLKGGMYALIAAAQE